MSKKTSKKSQREKTFEKKVRAISKQQAMRLMETKTVTKLSENTQLFHNLGDVRGGFLKGIGQGINNPTKGTNNQARIGNEIILKNLNIKLWVSNKLDRPNVMYRAILFWGDSLAAPAADTVLNWTGSGSIPNTMILNQNTEEFTFVRGQDRHLFSANSYAPDNERSQLLTLNYTPKGGKKIVYEDITGVPKLKDLYFVLYAYDAYGTLTTDNIASYAMNYKLTFKDA